MDSRVRQEGLQQGRGNEEREGGTFQLGNAKPRFREKMSNANLLDVDDSPFVSGPSVPLVAPTSTMPASTAGPTTTGEIGEIQFTNDPFSASTSVPAPQTELRSAAEGFGAEDDAAQPLAGGSGGGPSDDPEAGKTEVRATFNPLLALKQYFDFDTDEILARVTSATVKGYAGNFVEFLKGRPDLYGPFWIATTLIVVSTASGSFAQYLSGTGKSDVDKITASLFFFYGYVTLLPLAIWGALIYYRAPVPLTTLVCLYGYAMAVFVPTAVLCTIPITALRWALVLLAAAVSGTSLVMNLKQPFTQALQTKGTVCLAGVAGVHLALAFGLKLYFFYY